MQMSTAYDKQGNYYGSFGFLSILIEHSQLISVFIILILTAYFLWCGGFKISKSSLFLMSWLLVQIFVAIKFFYFGKILFGLSSLILITLQTIFILSFIHYLKITKNAIYVDDIILNFVVIFIVFNVYVLLLYPMSSFNNSARFHGITSNPQHMSVVLSITAPVALVTLSKHNIVKKIILSAAIIGSTSVLLLAAGSRTAIATFSLCLIIYFLITRRGLKSKLIIITAAMVVLIVYAEDLTYFVERFFISRGDTRSETWLKGLGYFIEHPFFGSGLNLGDRFLYVESTWISIISTTGVTGVLLSCAMLSSLARTFVVNLISKKSNHSNLAIFSFAILIGSFFEAFLLGVWKGHTLILLLVLECYKATNIKRMKERIK